MISLVGVWKAHGLDEAIHEAWRSGVVLCGMSAGSLCWFEQGLSGFDGQLRNVNGLGLLPWSNVVHYDEDNGSRRVAYHEAIRHGMRPGYAAENGAALHFVDQRLDRAVSSRPGARAYGVEMEGGELIETEIAPTYLGEPEPIAAAA